jgi:tetratricopeptide (TPR) repeat protein
MMSLYEGRLGNSTAAEAIAREATAAAEQSGDARVLAESLLRLGTSVLDSRPQEATELYRRALSLFRTAGDLIGEARCHINTGLIRQRSGELAAAEHAYEDALRAANHAHAADLEGTAALDLGVLSMRRGQLDHASRLFEQAHTLFTESANEAHRLVALYNMADLARETEDWSTASALYEQVMTVAARIGQPDVELGARAGHALASLSIGSRSVAEEAMRWIRTQVESRPDWWFQGRDRVDSLRVRLSAERGDDAHALRLLREAMEMAHQYDPYAAMYLVAECGPSLRHSADALLDLIDRTLPEAERQGFASVARRLSVLRLTLATTSIAN